MSPAQPAMQLIRVNATTGTVETDKHAFEVIYLHLLIAKADGEDLPLPPIWLTPDTARALANGLLSRLESFPSEPAGESPAH